ncbi:MAG: hypothetical protein R3F50_15095 [Gammaproteobacteria bacterium]|jgi:hypothetical protein
MKNLLIGSFLLSLAVPVLSLAQSSAPGVFNGTDIQQFCRASWLSGDDTDQRLYAACLREQQQALARIQADNGRYSNQDFYRVIAMPYCRSVQEQAKPLNLVQLSLCLEDEIDGFQDIQDLRRRYGANRIDVEAGPALAASGSWAAAAGLVRRTTNLKTIRRGGAS